MIKLIIYRHYKKYETEHNSIIEAAKEGLNDYNEGLAYPKKIVKDESLIWENHGPFSDSREKLEALADSDL